MKVLTKLSYVVGSFETLRAALDYDKHVAVDVETSGYYGAIQLVQLYQADWEAVIILVKPDPIELCAVLQKARIVCHNTSYEVSTMQTQLGELMGTPLFNWVPSAWEDTLLLAKLNFYQEETFALDDCYRYAFGVDPYASAGLDKKAMQKADWANPTPEMLQYAAIDVFYLLDLYEECNAWHESSNYLLDKAATSWAFKFQTNGLPLNPARIRKQIDENTAEIARIALPVNSNSWKQVRAYIDESESDGLALATFALNGNDKARDVQITRKLLKQNSFLNKYLTTCVNNRIYGKFTFTTKSGRGNCKDQNLQQLPRATKGVFEASATNVFVMSDYAQLELRYICALTGEHRMEKLFKDAIDMHTYTAEMMGVPRQQAKTCNFNLAYGGSANMLRSIFIKDVSLLLPIEQVRALKRAWHALWADLTTWQDQMTADWRDGIPQQTKLGRKFKSKLYTDAMNLPVQGGSAEIAKLAMHKMCKAVDASATLRDCAKFVNFVHDSFMWECPDDPTKYKELSQLIATAMHDAWTELVGHTLIPDLPMPVQIIVGKNWGDLEYNLETPRYTLEVGNV